MTYRARCDGRRRATRRIRARRWVRSHLRRRRAGSPNVPTARRVPTSFWPEMHAMAFASGNGWEGTLGGACPVQGQGTVDGFPWYFRARGNSWTWEICAFDEHGDLVALPVGVVAVEYRGTYGRTDYDASWMPPRHAWALIKQSIDRFRKRRP